MTIEIVNTKVVGEDGEYCGRGSPLGNPIPIDANHSRDQACDAYQGVFEQWIREGRPDKLAELNRLRLIYESTGTLRLRCFCAPLRCHVETIRDWIYANCFLDDSNY